METTADFEAMKRQWQEKMDAEKAAASVVFWRAEITFFCSAEADFSPHVTGFFMSKANAKAWLDEQKAKIAPLDKWSKEDEFTDPQYCDKATGDDYEANLYEEWTKD